MGSRGQAEEQSATKHEHNLWQAPRSKVILIISTAEPTTEAHQDGLLAPRALLHEACDYAWPGRGLRRSLRASMFEDATPIMGQREREPSSARSKPNNLTVPPPPCP